MCFIFLSFKLLFTYMVPLDVKITGVKFQTFSTNSRRRARPFFDTLYILYKFLYTLTVKNTKIAEKWSNMVNFHFEWFESIKALKISNFLLRLLISDQNWRFPKDIKIVKKQQQQNTIFSRFWYPWEIFDFGPKWANLSKS